MIGKKVENSEPDKAFDLNNDGVIDEADKALWETTNKELKKLSEIRLIILHLVLGMQCSK